MNEIIPIKNLIPGNINTPNLWTTLRILLTIHVIIADRVRNFNKLKLIKTYLRSTMANERLNCLEIL